MALHDLRLSLQFGAIAQAQRHRRALPRHFVARCIRHALQSPAEITVRIVDEEEGGALNQGYRGKTGPTNVLTFPYAHSPIGRCRAVCTGGRATSQAGGQNPGGPLRAPAGPRGLARPGLGPRDGA